MFSLRWRKFAVVALVVAGGPKAWAVQVTRVDSVAMSVSDLQRSVDFYTQVLSFQKISEAEVSGEAYEKLYGVFGVRVALARLRLGDEFIELRQFLAPEGRAIPVDSRSNDRWFQHIAIVVSDMDAAYALLRKNHVRYASSGPQRLPASNKKAGGIQAFYFKDPDGHPLELLQFPPDKGDARWRPHPNPLPGGEGGRIFLGIDHTAIVVDSTAKSLRFYRDKLGLKVKGESENVGTEQAHLNNVQGAHVRITGLRAAAGPGIEFLEYLSPTNGRPYPKDAEANDLVFTETVMKAEGLQGRAPWRDPDGHAVQLEGD